MPRRYLCQYSHHIPTSTRTKITLGNSVKYCTKAKTWLVQEGLPVIDLIKIQGLAVQLEWTETDLAFVCATCGSLQASAPHLALHVHAHATFSGFPALSTMRAYMPLGRVLNMFESNEFCPVTCPFCLYLFLGPACLQHHFKQKCWRNKAYASTEHMLQKLSNFSSCTPQLQSCLHCNRLDNLLRVHDWFRMKIFSRKPSAASLQRQDGSPFV